MSDKTYIDLRNRSSRMQDAYHYALLVANDEAGHESAFNGRASSEYMGFHGNQRAVNLAVGILRESGIPVIPVRLNSKAGLKVTGERIIAAIHDDEKRHRYIAYSDTLLPTIESEGDTAYIVIDDSDNFFDRWMAVNPSWQSDYIDILAGREGYHCPVTGASLVVKKMGYRTSIKILGYGDGADARRCASILAGNGDTAK